MDTQCLWTALAGIAENGKSVLIFYSAYLFWRIFMRDQRSVKLYFSIHCIFFSLFLQKGDEKIVFMCYIISDFFCTNNNIRI